MEISEKPSWAGAVSAGAEDADFAAAVCRLVFEGIGRDNSPVIGIVNGLGRKIA